MQLVYQYRAIRYFVITFLGSWIPWFVAIYFSHEEGMEVYQLVFIIFGLFAPCIVALIMIYKTKNKELIKDFWDRLSFSQIKRRFFPILFLLIPFILFLATAISLLFGQPLEQFTLSKVFGNIQAGNFSSIMIISIAPYIAPIGEELGWRGYGVDSIRNQFNLFKTSLLFGCIWAFWHLPLFFVKNFYENQIWHASIIYVINFFLGTLAVTFLINWVYYKNNRNIITSILLHFMFNFFSVVFQTEEFTKCIMTILLFIFIGFVIVRDRRLFFERS